MRSPRTATKSSPRSQQRRPNTAKNKINKLKKKKKRKQKVSTHPPTHLNRPGNANLDHEERQGFGRTSVNPTVLNILSIDIFKYKEIQILMMGKEKKTRKEQKGNI